MSRAGDSGSEVTLDEIDAALARYDDRPDAVIDAADVERICELGVRRAEIAGAAVPRPVEIAAGWARLGDWGAVERLLVKADGDQELSALLLALQGKGQMPAGVAGYARRIESQALRVSVQTMVAMELLDHDPRAAWDSLYEATETAKGIADQTTRESTMTALLAAWNDPRFDDPEARLVADKLRREHVRDPLTRVQLLATTAASLREVEPDRADAALSEATGVASQVETPATRAHALTVIATTAAHQDAEPAAVARLLEQAVQAADQVEDPSLRSQMLTGVVTSAANDTPVTTDATALAWAESVADRIEMPLLRDGALVDLVTALASAGAVHQATSIAGRVGGGEPADRARRALARAWASPKAPAAGSDEPHPVIRGARLADGLDDPVTRVEALVALADELVDRDVAVAGQALDRAEQVAERLIRDPAARSRALALIAGTAVRTDPDAARRLLERAEQTVSQAFSPFVRDDVLAAVVQTTAPQSTADPDAARRAEQLAERIASPTTRDQARLSVVAGFTSAATTDPEALGRAEQVIARMQDPGSREQGTVDLVRARAGQATSNPEAIAEVRRLAEQIHDPSARGQALSAVVSTLVTSAVAVAQTLSAADLSNIALPAPDLMPGAGVAGVPGMPEVPEIPEIPDLSEIPGVPDVSNIPGLPNLPPGMPGMSASPVDGPSAQSEEMRELLAQAEDVAGQIPDPSARCLALASGASALYLTDRAAASVLVDAAVAAAEAMTDPGPACQALTSIAMSVSSFDPPRARALLGRAEELAERVEGAIDRSQAFGMIAMAYAGLGTQPEALARAAALVDLGRVENAMLRCQVVTQLFSAYTATNDPDVADMLAWAEREALQVDNVEMKDMALMALMGAVSFMVRQGEPKPEAQLNQFLGWIRDPVNRVKALVRIASSITHRDPEYARRYLQRAEQEADAVEAPRERAGALAEVASAYAKGSMTGTTLPVGIEIPGMPTLEKVSQDGWRVFAKTARNPGFGHLELLTAVLRVGSGPAARIVAEQALETLARQ